MEEIPGDYLKLLGGQINPFLTELFNALYEGQYFPKTGANP